MDNFSIENIEISLFIALIGYAIFNGAVFMHYYIKYPKTLFNGIGVRRYTGLNIEKPDFIIHISDSLPGTLQIYLTNRCAYQLTNCIFYGCKVTNFSGSPKTILENRPLIWTGGYLGEKDLDKDGSLSAFVFGVIGTDEAWFRTQSPSPHRVARGTYILHLEFKAIYLWKKIVYPIDIKVNYNQVITGELLPATS